jgi:tetratricopeptide (TPR) repeat protein
MADDAPASEKVSEAPLSNETKAGDSEIGIPLPPLEPPVDPEVARQRLAAEIRRLDIVLALLVIVLGGFLAAFTVRNSDFWQHLAAGRLYAHGHFDFGVDPFSYTTGDNYYVNHSWIYDLVLYVAASLAGGPESPIGGIVLVLLKTLLVALLAVILLSIRRPDQSLWAPAFCTAFALVCMSLRLLFQPTVVSMLFLGLTLYILQSPRYAGGRLDAESRSPLRVYWCLPVLFVAWVNLDAWFFLGPVTVALFLLGQAVQQWTSPIRTGPDSPEPGQLRTLFLVLLAGCCACLVNPHTYHALTLPVQLGLSQNVEALERDNLLRRLFESPFHEDNFQAGSSFYNVANFSYFPLLLLGLVSFVLNMGRNYRWWRAFLWLSFAALSAYESRNVPFFAVIAGPITALNLQDFAASRALNLRSMTSRALTWSLGGRIATLVLFVLLILATWPGWLHGRPSDFSQSHRVALAVHVDESMRQAATQIGAWRGQGLLPPNENGFNDVPDLVNYADWFCADEQGRPLEKGFFDYRFDAYSPAVTAEYVDTRAALRGKQLAGADQDNRRANWQETFRKNKISHLILNRQIDPEAFGVWARFLPDWQQWRLIYVDGRTMIYLWDDPRNPRRPGEKLPARYDPDALAFGPLAKRIPMENIGRAPQLPDTWTRFLHGVPALPSEVDQSDVDQMYFRMISRYWIAPYLCSRQIQAWSTMVGASVACPGAGTVGAQTTLLFTTMPTLAGLMGNNNAVNLLTQRADLGPPGAAVMAVRSALRAIAAGPNSSAPYFAEAYAYRAISGSQEDQWTGRRGTPPSLPRQQLRQVQITTALERGLMLRPNDLDSHLQLREIYLQQNYLDLALEHTRAAVDLFKARAYALRGSGDQENRDKEIESLEKGLEKLDTEVKRRENEFELAATNQPLNAKAQLALSKGLGKRARELVLESDMSLVTAREIPLLMNLLLSTGRIELAKDLLSDEARTTFGENFEWVSALLEAATGNVGKAGAYLDEMIDRQEKTGVATMLMVTRNQLFGPMGPQLFAMTNQVAGTTRQLADFIVIRGMLAMDEGDVPTAAKAFRHALEMSSDGQFEFESKPIAVRYLELIAQAGGEQSSTDSGENNAQK